MSKDEAKKEKKAAKKAAAAAAAAAAGADVSMASVAGDETVGDVSTVSTKSKKDKKVKKEKSAASTSAAGMEVDVKDEEDEEDGGAELDLSTLSPIAKPLADKKLQKKVFKTIKKASKSRGHVKRGVKEVVKGLRKGEKGLVILAGDISPMDILSHIPILCEESDVPYIFVASKESLGAASSTKRPTSTVMIVPDAGKKKGKQGTEMKEDYTEELSSASKEIKKLGEKLILG